MACSNIFDKREKWMAGSRFRRKRRRCPAMTMF